MSLAGKDRGNFLAPDFLHGSKNAQLVIDEYIVVSGIPLFHVLQLLLLVNVDQDVSSHRFGDAGTLNLAGLEYNIAIREYDCRAPLLNVFHGIQRIRIKARGKRIIDEKV